MAAAQRLLARAVRPRQVPEADPGDGDERDAPHRGVDRERQGRDEPHPRRPRVAGAAPAHGALGRRSGARGESARLPGRRQAARREPRARRVDRSQDRRRDPRRVRQGARARAHDRDRELPRGVRPPHARRRRAARRGRQARARTRRRRRQEHDRAADRHREQRSAPRHRPRKSPDPSRARPSGRALDGAARRDASRPVLPAGEHRSSCDRPGTCRRAARRSI